MREQAHLHEYVYREFEDVLRVLRADLTYANRRMARLAVRVDEFDASLLVFRVVGGRQEPVTELALVIAPVRGMLPAAAAAERFIEDLVLELEDALPAPRRRSTEPPRILIEASDLGMGFAAERLLQQAGYETALCGGPEELPRRRCPLVTTGTCALAEEADVIVHTLNPDRPRDAEVLRALRSHYPEKPVVVEIPASSRARHQELLEGCSIVEYMMVREPLLDAVEEAVARG